MPSITFPAAALLSVLGVAAVRLQPAGAPTPAPRAAVAGPARSATAPARRPQYFRACDPAAVRPCGAAQELSLAAARVQASQVAASRRMAVPAVLELVAASIEPFHGGQPAAPRVNVLALNLALDVEAALARAHEEPGR